MKTRLTAIGLITFLATASPPLFAQWGRYPTPGVPRTPDGKPNVSAAAPRTADGKPDLSGIWENTWMIQFRRQVPSPSPTTGGPPVATFSDVGAGFKESLPLRPW